MADVSTDRPSSVASHAGASGARPAPLPPLGRGRRDGGAHAGGGEGNTRSSSTCSSSSSSSRSRRSRSRIAIGLNFWSVLLLRVVAAALRVRSCHEILLSRREDNTGGSPERGRCGDRPRRVGHRAGGGGNHQCCFSSKDKRCDDERLLLAIRGGRLDRDSLNDTRYDSHPVSVGSTLLRLERHRRLSHPHHHPPLLRGGAVGIKTHDDREEEGATAAIPERFSNYSTTTSTTRTFAAAAFTVPLESASGTMHVRAFVGEPAQVQIWIVDTGSHLTATSCAPLSRAAPLRHYNPTRSSTHHALTCGMCELSQTSSSGGTLCRRLVDGADDDDGGDATQHKRKCRVTQRYTEGSKWSAYEANDFVTLSTNNQYDEVSIRQSTIPFTFGCQTSCTGLFQQQYANGILGLERSSVSYVSQLKQRGLIERNAFSICTNPQDGSDGGGNSSAKEDGRMGLGGAVAHRHVSPMQYTSIVHAEAHGMYRVEVVQVWLGNDCLVNATRNSQLLEGAFNRPRGKGTVVDSGTTDTFLPSGLAAEWEDSWFRQTGRPWKRRTDSYTHASFQLLPAVTLHLARRRRDPAGDESAATNDSKGSTLRWVIPPEHYMEASSNNGINGAASSSAARRTSSSDHSSFPWSGSRIFTNRMYVDEADGRPRLERDAGIRRAV
jgi:Xylanase inhibitor N-terminal